MLKTALQLRKPVDELLRRIRERFEGYTAFTIGPSDFLARPTDNISWNTIKDFCSFLEPLKDATVLMSASTYPTPGLAVPVFVHLQQHVNQTVASANGFRSQHVKAFAVAIQAKLTQYQDLMVNDHSVISALLDPRVKGSLANCGIDVDDAKALVEFISFDE
uniref:hAT-like transposase RNase-H fold domain-containing protein n=1 Tax=Spongospora subterranea TaxID=70186 RepID=A0A0H5RTI1_9EUKA|eukprot:CRZ12049.1 hypothetical protein [Spongospora subterranea]